MSRGWNTQKAPERPELLKARFFDGGQLISLSFNGAYL